MKKNSRFTYRSPVSWKYNVCLLCLVFLILIYGFLKLELDLNLSPNTNDSSKSFLYDFKDTQNLFTATYNESEKNLQTNVFDVINYIESITLGSKSYAYHVLKTLLNSTLMKELQLDTISFIERNGMVVLGDVESPCLIPRELRIKYKDERWKGFTLPLLTALDPGRLGNKMGEYATLFSLGRLYNASVLIHPSMHTNLRQIFPHLSVPILPDTGWFRVTNVESATNQYVFSPIELASSGLLGPKLFLIHGYPFEISLFNSIREEILEEFKFSESHRRKVEKFFSGIVQKFIVSNQMKNVTFIGFHMRRTDYSKHIKNFGGWLPGEKYFRRALHYYRSKFAVPLFLASSDDNQYLRSSLGEEKDVIIVEEEDGPTSLAILAACNHSIITLGSFGFWSGYLAGGEVVFPDVEFSKPYRFSKQYYTDANIKFFTPL